MQAGECLSKTLPWERHWVLTPSLSMVLSSPLVACGYLRTYPSRASLCLCKANRLCVEKVPDKRSLNTTSKGLPEKGHLFRPCENFFCTQWGFLMPLVWPLQGFQGAREPTCKGPVEVGKRERAVGGVHWWIRELTSWAHPSPASFWVSRGNFAQLNESSKQSCGAE